LGRGGEEDKIGHFAEFKKMTRPDYGAELQKVWRLATAPLRPLPGFIIPGAPKCGTSSLYDLIALHPGVRRAMRKEPTNFLHYPGSELRARMFQPLGAGRFLCGEGSVEYFAHPEGPGNVAAVVPGVRLIFLLRDPIERAWSDYRMFVRAGKERGDFTEVVRKAAQWLADPTMEELCRAAARQSFSPLRYVLNGMYGTLLARWEAAFGREQMLVLSAEELFQNGAGVAERVYRFLGVSEYTVAEVPHARDSGELGKVVPEEAREILRAFYQPQVEAVEAWLGRKPEWKHFLGGEP
jgi:hypothetical protein